MPPEDSSGLSPFGFCPNVFRNMGRASLTHSNSPASYPTYTLLEGSPEWVTFHYHDNNDTYINPFILQTDFPGVACFTPPTNPVGQVPSIPIMKKLRLGEAAKQIISVPTCFILSFINPHTTSSSRRKIFSRPVSPVMYILEVLVLGIVSMRTVLLWSLRYCPMCVYVRMVRKGKSSW